MIHCVDRNYLVYDIANFREKNKQKFVKDELQS